MPGQKAVANPMTVADYCRGLNERGIFVNQDYQRQGDIWSKQAQSFFVESIILGYPIPKIFLYQKLDLRSRTVIKEIVDGQQRSLALKNFFNGQYALSNNIETDRLKGLRYEDLNEEDQTNFLSYSLPIDQFSGAPEREVRDSFRRMNASNVPLNAEEQRHARFQGPFKWFIIKIGHRYQEALIGLGVLSRKQALRMVDYNPHNPFGSGFEPPSPCDILMMTTA